VEEVKNRGGRGFLEIFGDSLQVALSVVYPEVEWKPWLFASVPNGFWSHESHRKACLEWIGKELNINSLSDWYAIELNDVLKEKQCTLCGMLSLFYKGSLQRALIHLYPEYDWKPWLFSHTKHRFWQELENRQAFIIWLSKEFQIVKNDQWYSMKFSNLTEKKGTHSFLQFYGGSIKRALSELCLEHQWKPWMFLFSPRSFWSQEINQKQYLQWLADELSIGNHTHWYTISTADIGRLKGGHTLLKRFHGSMQSTLCALLPEYPWKTWLFRQTKKGFWKKSPLSLTVASSVSCNLETHQEHWQPLLEDQAEMLRWLERKLCIAYHDEWYEISQQHITHFGANSSLHSSDDLRDRETNGNLGFSKGIRGLLRYLEVLYPSYPWKERSFDFVSSFKTQRLMYRMLREMSPSLANDLQFNSLQSFPFSIYPISLDLYSPSFSLAIEYHGIQHYEFTEYFGAVKKQQLRDQAKRQLCMINGISLIEINWKSWNLEKQSLLAMIQSRRPDIFCSK